MELDLESLEMFADEQGLTGGGCYTFLTICVEDSQVWEMVP
jgi:hypothetical protein